MNITTEWIMHNILEDLLRFRDIHAQLLNFLTLRCKGEIIASYDIIFTISVVMTILTNATSNQTVNP